LAPNQAGVTGEGATGLDVARQGQEAAGLVQEQVGRLKSLAQDQATAQISSQKARAAGSLGAVADALHDVGRQVDARDEGGIGPYITMAADQLDALSGALRDQNLDELLAAMARLARRQPALFAAAAFGLGFAATRFLRSSQPS
jgi:hypothetical protein